jgi:hypothetical protein
MSSFQDRHGHYSPGSFSEGTFVSNSADVPSSADISLAFLATSSLCRAKLGWPKVQGQFGHSERCHPRAAASP